MQITRNFRLFNSYGYICFCLFDADEDKSSNSDLAMTLKFIEENMELREENFTCDKSQKYGYFGKNYESYMRSTVDKYSEAEAQLNGDKVIKAKVLSEEHPEYLPQFIEEIAKSLFLIKEKSDDETVKM